MMQVEYVDLGLPGTLDQNDGGKSRARGQLPGCTASKRVTRDLTKRLTVGWFFFVTILGILQSVASSDHTILLMHTNVV